MPHVTGEGRAGSWLRQAALSLFFCTQEEAAVAGYTERPTVHVTFEDSEASLLVALVGWEKDAAEKRGEDPRAVTAAGVLRKLVGAEFLALRRAATPHPFDGRHSTQPRSSFMVTSCRLMPRTPPPPPVRGGGRPKAHTRKPKATQ